MEVREIMADRFNLLVKTFKQANPNLTHEKAQKRVKEYHDTIKNNPAPLAHSGGPYPIDSCKKDETQKISRFYQSLALQHIRPKGYEKCMKLPYGLYCPSTEVNNAD